VEVPEVTRLDNEPTIVFPENTLVDSQGNPLSEADTKIVYEGFGENGDK
jgi:hypothetical protein